MPDAQLAAYGVGILLLIGSLAAIVRGFRRDVEQIVEDKIAPFAVRLTSLEAALRDEREERRRMEREK